MSAWNKVLGALGAFAGALVEVGKAVERADRPRIIVVEERPVVLDLFSPRETVVEERRDIFGNVTYRRYRRW